MSVSQDLCSLVEELVERQRISRLDTVVFLLFPITIATMTWLAGMVSEFGTLPNAQILPGISLVAIPMMAAGTLEVGLLLAALSFTIGYLNDHAHRHVTAVWLLIFSSGMFATVMGGIYASAFIGQLVTTIPQLLWLFYTPFAFGMGATIGLATSKSTRKIVTWVQTNAPRTYAAASWNFSELRPEMVRYYTLCAKLCWIGTCVTYAAIVLSAILIIGLSRTVALHGVIVGLMAIGIIMIVDP